MAYTKTNWNNDTAPAINEDNLNKIENGIYDAHQDIDNLNNDFNKIKIYNEEEQIIGEFKNKALYRKVIITTTAASINNWKTLTSGLNASEILKVDGYYSENSNENKILPYSTGTNSMYFQLNKTNHELQEAHTFSSANSKEICIILEYTKN